MNRFLLAVPAAAILTLAVMAAGCGGGKSTEGEYYLDDIDASKIVPYTDTMKSVTIGDRTWMTGNLNVETDSSWGVRLGRLYAWNAAKSACAGLGNGWRLPDTADWNALVAATGCKETAGIKLKSREHWAESALGNNSIGFSATPSGYRDLDGKNKYDLNDHVFWWSATEADANIAYSRHIRSFDIEVGSDSVSKGLGLSVRCVKDAPIDSAAIAARQTAEIEAIKAAPVPQTVKIGGKTWTRHNINIETVDSWCYNDNGVYCDMYGRLYTWKAADRVCAGLGEGWRLPDTLDWRIMIRAIGREEKAATKLKAATGWKTPVCTEDDMDDCPPAGTDDFGFSALPGGYRIPPDGKFYDAEIRGYWWGATEYYCSNAFYLSMSYNDEHARYWDVSALAHASALSAGDKNAAYSVRCVRDW